MSPKNDPRPPTEAPRATQDRLHRPQEPSKTASRGFPVWVWATSRPRSACQIAFPLGFGSLFGPRRPTTANKGPKSGPRSPTKAPRAAQDRLQRPKSGPRSPAEAPRATQDRPHKPQELSKTAHRGPKFDPRPPAEAPRATQDRTHRPRERPKTTHRGPSTSHSAINRKYTSKNA